MWWYFVTRQEQWHKWEEDIDPVACMRMHTFKFFVCSERPSGCRDKMRDETHRHEVVEGLLVQVQGGFVLPLLVRLDRLLCACARMKIDS